MSRGKWRRHRDYAIRNGQFVHANGQAGQEMLGAFGIGDLDAWDREFDAQMKGSGPSVAAGTTGYQQWLTDSQAGKRTHYPGGAPGGVTQADTSCYHVQDEIDIGPHQILVTGAHDVSQEELNRMQFRGRMLVTPDLGIYLTHAWENKLKAPKPLPAGLDLPSFEIRGKVPSGLAATVKFIAEERAAYATAKAEAEKLPDAWRWPYVLIGWPDQGVINVEVAAQVVEYILRQLKAGKVVDTGCAGAHGRTGTLLAMLLIDAEKLTPEQAITSVRQRHCHKAIESAAQVQAIFGFGGTIATAEEVKRLAR